ncbi:MAG: 6-carboxytetrahydropterin synthase QueD [Bdellovibrionales bacterium RIFOXYD1_FULL_53_11]|nr:MAG: 6-carboxytetrahydropterin synthase QueD [Bdellovibrionales bacterium RIFOXYD1_FULL_53_11]
MYELRVQGRFSAAHKLRGYEGDCARLHGHSWRLEFALRAEGLDATGMAVDFKEIKQIIRDITGVWDHRNLSELEDFKEMNPTAENIARLAFERFSQALSARAACASRAAHAVRVTVWESENCSASYSGAACA